MGEKDGATRLDLLVNKLGSQGADAGTKIRQKKTAGQNARPLAFKETDLVGQLRLSIEPMFVLRLRIVIMRLPVLATIEPRVPELHRHTGTVLMRQG